MSTPPKTPGWGPALFGWGRSTAKKQRESSNGSFMNGPSTNLFGASSPPRPMPPLGVQFGSSAPGGGNNTTDAAHFGISGKIPQQRQPQQLPRVSFADTIRNSPWGPQQQSSSLARSIERGITPEGPQQQQPSTIIETNTRKAIVTKRRTTSKYRPRSVTLNKHVSASAAGTLLNQEIDRDAIRKCLAAPYSRPTSGIQTLSLGNVRVLRAGRTLNESRMRLMDASQQRKGIEDERVQPHQQQQDQLLLMPAASSDSDQQPKSKRAKVRKQSSSPQSANSSQVSSLVSPSSIFSHPVPPASLRPPDTDEPYSCLIGLVEEEYGVDKSLLRGEPQSSLAAFRPLKTAVRKPDADLVVDASEFDEKPEMQKQPEGVRFNLPKKTKKTPTKVETDDSVGEDWTCQHCQASNEGDESACQKCNKRRATKVSGWGDAFNNLGQSGWKCHVCDVRNTDESLTKCSSCETPRAGSFLSAATKPQSSGEPKPLESATSFAGSTFQAPPSNGTINGNGGTTTAPAPASKFSFGAPTTTAAPASGTGFRFGAVPASTTPAPGTGSEAMANGSTGGFQFGSTVTTKAGPLGTEAQKPAGGFVFSATTSNALGQQPQPTDGATPAVDESKAAQPAPITVQFGSPPKSSGGESMPPTPAPLAFQFGTQPTVSQQAPPAAVPTPFEQKQESKPAFVFCGQPTAQIAKEENMAESATSSAASKPFVFGKINVAPDAPASGAAPAAAAPPGPSNGFALPTSTGEKNDAKPATAGFAAADFKSLNSRPPENGDRPAGAGAFSFGGPPAILASGQPQELDSARVKKRRSEAENNGVSSAEFQFGAWSSSDANKSSGTTAQSSGAPGVSAFGFESAANNMATETDSAAPTPSVTGSFGGAPAFGSATAAPPPAPAFQFGSQAPSGAFKFGGTSTGDAMSGAAPGFGGFGAPSGATQPSSAPSFGQPGFGATSAATHSAGGSFGQTPVPSFGSSTPAVAPFGGGTASVAPSQGFVFGSATGFGSAHPQPKPGSWGSGFPPSSAPPNSQFGSFGSAPALGFGSANAMAPQPFGNSTSQSTAGFAAAPPPISFGAAATDPAAGGFAMGTGGNTRRRRMIKAKRPAK